MNKQAILNTAESRYDEDGGHYIVESPFFDRIIGAGATVQEALEEFEANVDEMCEALLEGTLAGYNKHGRPTGAFKTLSINVREKVQKGLSEEARELGISVDELVEGLYKFYYLRKELDAASSNVQ